MANTTTSTNMSLPIPIVGQETGPQYATDLNNCLTLIDAHTHAPGSGTQITPSGLNINADLTFSSNSATNLKEVTFTSQNSVLTGTNFISFINGNLYVNDSSGNQIPITSGGGVAGSPGSIGSLAAPASATYSAGSKLFTWLADSAKSAAMDNGAVTVRETNVASAKGVTIQSASSLASDYSLTFPGALPASTQYMTSSSSGALSFSTSNSISAARTRATGTTVAAGGVAISTSSGVFLTSSTSYVDVTNLTVTITTSGRPLFVGLAADGSGTSFSTIFSSRTAGSTSTLIKVIRDPSGSNTTIGIYAVENIPAGATSTLIAIPSSSVNFIDVVAAGTYTYKVQMLCGLGGSSPSSEIDYTSLIAYEL